LPSSGMIAPCVSMAWMGSISSSMSHIFKKEIGKLQGKSLLLHNYLLRNDQTFLGCLI
jgi:hypothetical protein